MPTLLFKLTSQNPGSICLIDETDTVPNGHQYSVERIKPDGDTVTSASRFADHQSALIEFLRLVKEDTDEEFEICN